MLYRTVVVISELETTVRVAAVPLNLTLDAPVRLVPRIVTTAPTLLEVGSVLTNGPNPVDSLTHPPVPLAVSNIHPSGHCDSRRGAGFLTTIAKPVVLTGLS